MKKMTRTMISAVLALSLSVVSCFALPILTENEVDFTATIASSNTVNVCANFSYSNAQINEINNGHSGLGVYTLDFCAEPVSGVPAKMGYSGDYYTNFPNPYPDADDDDGNGYNEEFEIAIQGRLTMGKAYVLRAEYVKAPSVTSGAINLNEQYSVAVTVGGDKFNTVPGTSNAIATAWLTSGRSRSAVEPNVLNSQKEIPTECLLKEQATSIEELDAVILRNEQDYQNMLATNSRPQQITSVVTFDGPITMDNLKSLLNESGATLLNYQAKFINAAGDWCTYGSNTLDEKLLVDKANTAAIGAGVSHTSYEGIVCAELEFQTDTPAYDVLNKSDLVYFVDTSRALVADNNQNYILPSYAWELASLREN